MAMMQNRADVVWEGDLREGKGRLKVQSGAFPEQTVTFNARTAATSGTTNPEELIAAAHAICYSMAFSNHLSQNGSPPKQLRVSAISSLDRVEGGLKISGVDLQVEGDVPGLEPADFERLAKEAEQKCPVSNALRGNVEIRLEAKPVASATR
jgi:osmotically inducible protein OsmC